MGGLRSEILAVKCIWIEMYNTVAYLRPIIQCLPFCLNVLEFCTAYGTFQWPAERAVEGNG